MKKTSFGSWQFILIAFLSFILYSSAKAQSLKIGDTVPAFSLYNQDGKVFNSADYVGKSILVVYFYPKDESMVCTKEACSFRDGFDQFTKAGAMVIGINGGTVASHKEFQQHYKLPFILLSDPGDKVYKQFGVKAKLFLSSRKTFVIDLKGKVVYTHTAMLEGKEHADDALLFIKSAKAK
jgi:peroxiredoxin Q/BCP